MSRIILESLLADLVGPTPGNSFEATPDLSEHPFQQRYVFGGDHARLEPHLDMREQAIRDVFQVGSTMSVALLTKRFYQLLDLGLAGLVAALDRFLVLAHSRLPATRCQ